MPIKEYRARIHMLIKGVVQGVGFRPFVYNLARTLDLTGWVNNSAQGVEIEAEGKEVFLESFAERIRSEAPPLAVIEEITLTKLPPADYKDFVIKDSAKGEIKFTLVSPDVAICPECLAELNDPENRRYRYPLINCTNCGPRFTIIQDIPYDRPYTTMANFPMCPDCLKEYYDPQNRRFHAQPTACPACGPQVVLLDRQGKQVAAQDAPEKAVELLKQGHILAVKGLGGYHLVCDALSQTSVQRLRNLKNRDAKPFAVMMPDIEVVKKYCDITNEEEIALISERCPIVLLRKKDDSAVAFDVAPKNRYLGVMLPYAPLHHLLFQNGSEVLVMTSGNSSGEAIEYKDNEALANLGSIADYFLTHNREIHIRTDDSVVRFFKGRQRMLRRSRGYAPLPVKLPFEIDNILALGAELKNTVCLTKGNSAFLSQHIGDLENLSNMLAFEKAVDHLQTIFNLTPQAVAYDLHPDYLSTKYAEDIKGLTKFPIQHHHAHIASCMAENGVVSDVIGVAFDGSGYGTDGTIWGGEFFTGNYQGFVRWANFEYVPLPGGNAAIKQPWRMALSYLLTMFDQNITQMPLPPFQDTDSYKLGIVKNLILNGRANLLTSSAGRLFDAVAALVGVRQEISYEGQAAIELEQLALPELHCEGYRFILNRATWPWTIQFKPMFEEIIREILANEAIEVMAARFHQTLADVILATCKLIRNDTGIDNVVLSGGVFQNLLLLDKSVKCLEKDGFQVYTHSKVPANDGGISLGQAVIAGQIRKGVSF